MGRIANWKQWILFFLILCVGIFARTWEFNRLPPGLNADEAAIGVEAFSLLNFGVDRNGVSFPIHFISWGSGQNFLYGYLIIPFLAFARNLNPATVRLPMLISGILSLPLMFYVGKKTLNAGFGLLSMFFLAISPWHILLSRWGLDCNIFPFFFLAGYACLLRATQRSRWFFAACVLFGLCLYAYGTSYVMVPFFMLCTVVILAQAKILSFKKQIPGIIAFTVIAAPIAVFIAINTFNWNSIHLGPVTIPRFPMQARFGPIYAGLQFRDLASNLWATLKVLIIQTDGLIYNAFEPYGYFYKITFPLTLAGLLLVILVKNNQNRVERLLLLAWISGSVLVGIIQPININKLNIIFIPLLLCTAFCVDWLNHRFTYSTAIAICALLAGFVFFTIAYHGESYRRQADLKFHTGLLPAIAFARSINNGPVCITDKITMPYIFVLFSEQTNPANYLANIKYQDPLSPLRQVISMERYTFGKQVCLFTPSTTYLLASDESFTHSGSKYNVEFFNEFKVFYPAQ